MGTLLANNNIGHLRVQLMIGVGGAILYVLYRKIFHQTPEERA